MSTSIYTELDLRKLKGQALKDVWHGMIGKGPGLKNTTGMKTTEDIIQAILEGQTNPAFLTQFTGRQHKQTEEVHDKEKEMPPKEKKKPGPKPQLVQQEPAKIQAVESMDKPKKGIEVQRLKLRKYHIGESSYFVDLQNNNVYTVENNRPGPTCGKWNPETKEIMTHS